MANNWDASIKLLYPADSGTFFTADTVKLGTDFDLVANVEVGRGIHQFTDKYTLHVWVRNLSRSTTIAKGSITGPLKPSTDEYREELRVQIPQADWTGQAALGDVLEAVASYIVEAGSNSDNSTATSQQFLVVTD